MNIPEKLISVFKRHKKPQTPAIPRVPLAFRVGIVGHRPNRLDKADIGQLKGVLRSILDAVKEEVVFFAENHADFYQENSTPVLRAISPLAEGTDRLFAEEAIELGFKLCCVMPFPQEEFKKDFEPGNALEKDSLKRFAGLLDKATKETDLTCFQLDGNRDNSGRAYGTGGRVVLNQSDILIVVWDGDRQDKIGGTEETFAEAMNQGVPVVWVDACAPHSWQILDPGISLPKLNGEQRLVPSGGELESLMKLTKAMIELPGPGSSAENPKQKLEAFYREKQPKFSCAVVWKVFQNIFGKTFKELIIEAFKSVFKDKKLPFVTFRVKPFEEAVIEDWPGVKETPSAFAKMVDLLRPFYAWPDKLAVIYSDRYRSTFVLAFLLAAIAVGLALIPIGFSLAPHGLLESYAIWFEFIIIASILILVWIGNHFRWHERWIEYRLVAELIRHLRLSVALGGGRSFPQMPAHWSTYGHPGSSWMAWYYRNVERYLGLPDIVVNKPYLTECLGDLLNLVQGQSRYHGSNAERCQKIEHRLHTLGMFFLGMTLVACGLHLLPVFWGVHFPGWAPNLLTAFCGFFPALGAAFAGIINQGEFLRITKRSAAMQKQMDELVEKIHRLQLTVICSQDISKEGVYETAVQLATDTARLMVYEVLDWRVVFMDRPLKPPA